MRTITQLIEEAVAMNSLLAIEQPNDLQTLLGSLVKLESMLARANEMLAEAKMLKEETTMRIIAQDGMLKELKPSLAAKYLNASLRMESYAIDLVDGACSTLRNTMDSRRTRISALKEEMRQLSSPDMYRDRMPQKN